MFRYSYFTENIANYGIKTKKLRINPYIQVILSSGTFEQMYNMLKAKEGSL